MRKVLMFHRVLPSENIHPADPYYARGTLIDTAFFEKTIVDYKEKGYTFLPLVEFNAQKNQENVITLTFDDGYVDNYLHVLPILAKHNIFATFYPTIGYCKEQTIAPLDYYYYYVRTHIQGDTTNWITGPQKKAFLSLNIQAQKDRIHELFENKLPSPAETQIKYLNLRQIQELASLGHEIGGHSLYHDIYTNLTEKEIIADYREMNSIFHSINIKIRTFAYTDGRYNPLIIDILRRNGIESACTIRSKQLSANREFEIEREFVTQNIGQC